MIDEVLGQECCSDENPVWMQSFCDWELRLIRNCRTYARNDPAGFPGHKLILLIVKMAKLLDEKEKCSCRKK